MILRVVGCVGHWETFDYDRAADHAIAYVERERLSTKERPLKFDC